MSERRDFFRQVAAAVVRAEPAPPDPPDPWLDR